VTAIGSGRGVVTPRYVLRVRTGHRVGRIAHGREAADACLRCGRRDQAGHGGPALRRS